MGKQRRGREGSADRGGSAWAEQDGHAGKGNRAAKVYAGARPSTDRGNAIMVVIARQGDRETGRWQGPMNWPADWEELPVMFTGRRVDDRWEWSDERGDRVCLYSATPAGCGMEIKPWAYQRGATELVVTIVVDPGAKPAGASAQGLGTQGLGTGEDARDRAEASGSRSVDEAFRGVFSDMLGTASREAGLAEGVGLGEQGAGAAQGASGERAVAGRGEDAGQNASKRGGEQGGSVTPSWITRSGAAVDNEWGGRTPDLDHGKQGGSAGGQAGGEGHLLGLWNGPIDIAATVAIAVNVAIVLLDADVNGLGKKFLGKVVGGLAGKELRKELAEEAARAVARRMPEVEKQLEADAGYRAMSQAEKDAVRTRARARLEREYHEKARAYFAEQAERSEALVRGRADEASQVDGIASHERELAEANARAYRELERAAADNAGLEVASIGRAADTAANMTKVKSGAAAAAKGLAREQRVAELVGGTVSRQQVKTPFGSTDIDVIGPAGELISVGGPAKAFSLSTFGTHLKRLQAAADARGVPARVFLESGTPQNVIDLAIRRLGADNVVIF